MKATDVDIRWDPKLPVFASDRYLRLMSAEFGWLGGLDRSGDLACILPFAIVNKGLLRLVRFPVETIAVKGALDLQSERAFLNDAVGRLRSMGADVIVPATFNSLFRTCPDGALSAPYGNVVVDLTRSEDDLWARVHNKHRNVIRNATRQGVTVKSGHEHLRTAFDLTMASFLRSARGPIGRQRVRARLRFSDFQRLADALGDDVKVLVAERDGVAQCAAVLPYSLHSAYYMHGGSIHKPTLGASNLLQWEAMRMFRAMGVERYNFFGIRIDPTGGSKAEGLRMFKERFGGAFIEVVMWKLPLRPLKYALYQIAAGIRNGGDVVDQERRRRRIAGSGGQEPPPAAETGDGA